MFWFFSSTVFVCPALVDLVRPVLRWLAPRTSGVGAAGEKKPDVAAGLEVPDNVAVQLEEVRGRQGDVVTQHISRGTLTVGGFDFVSLDGSVSYNSVKKKVRFISMYISRKPGDVLRVPRMSPPTTNMSPEIRSPYGVAIRVRGLSR